MNLATQLRQEEGSVPHAYQDHLGFWTIGIGRLVDQRKPGSAPFAPTYGTWARGDIVKNGSPAVGSPKGWVCTVSGTPGTWVSEGNL